MYSRQAAVIFFLCFMVTTGFAQDDSEAANAFNDVLFACVKEYSALDRQARQENDDVKRKQFYRKVCEIKARHYLPVARRYPWYERRMGFLVQCVSVSPEALDLLIKEHPADLAGDHLLKEAAMNPFFEYDYPLIMQSKLGGVAKAKATLGLALACRLNANIAGNAQRIAAADRYCDDGMSLCKTLIQEHGALLIEFDRSSVLNSTRYFSSIIPVKELAENLHYELEHVRIGHPMPELIGMDQDGKAMKLSDFKGKVVLLDFFSLHPWTTYTNEESLLPRRQALVKTMTGKPFVLLGIYVKVEMEKAEPVTAGMPWRLFTDQPDPSRLPTSKQWSILQLPTTYLIDSKGILRSKTYVHFPKKYAHLVEKEIELLLKEMK